MTNDQEADPLELTGAAAGAQPFDHVIVPVDGSSAAARAVPAGAAFAALAGAGLSIVTVVESGGIDDRERYLAGLAAELVETPVHTAVLPGHPVAAEVMAFARRFERPLVCLSSHGRGRLAGAALGSVATSLVHDLHTPVLVLGPHAPAERFEPRRLVACLDASRQAAQIVPVAALWAARFGLTVHIVEVIAPEARARLEEAGLDAMETGYVKRVAQELADQGIEATWEALHDPHPASALCRYADALDGAVVAMTTHARTGLRLAALGSVASGVIHATSRPVLLIKP